VPIAWAVAAALAGRALVVYGLVGVWRAVAMRMGRRMDDRADRAGRKKQADAGFPAGWLHVIFWSGLRGAVSTALALSLPIGFPNRSLLQGITLGVVLFTLLFQATTAEVVVARWGPRREASRRSRPGGGRSIEPNAPISNSASSGSTSAATEADR
jgi:NhaP-type Na+/H+ or K+/H+ antiporter